MDTPGGNIGVVGAACVLAVTLIGRVNGMITDERLSAALVIMGATVFSYLFSWAFTDGYKNYKWPPERFDERKVRQKIFVCAWLSGGLMMLFVGAATLWLTVNEPKILVPLSLAWVALSIFVGATSPWLWSFTFDNVFPWFKKTFISRRRD